MKQLKHKIMDYTRFGQVLLALSTILMLGLLIPNGEKTNTQLIAMFTTILLFLGTAMFFFYRVKKAKEKLEEENEVQSR